MKNMLEQNANICLGLFYITFFGGWDLFYSQTKKQLSVCMCSTMFRPKTIYQFRCVLQSFSYQGMSRPKFSMLVRVLTIGIKLVSILHVEPKPTTMQLFVLHLQSISPPLQSKHFNKQAFPGVIYYSSRCLKNGSWFCLSKYVPCPPSSYQ